MQRCEVTGRIYRNRRELAAELARLDGLIAATEAIEGAFATAFEAGATRRLPAEFGAAWNATSDAVAALKSERDEVEANPRPIPGHEAVTYALVKANID